MPKTPLSTRILSADPDGVLRITEQTGRHFSTSRQDEEKERMNEANRQAQLNRGKSNDKGVEGSNKVG